VSVFLVNALIALGACGGGIATIDATTGADAGENDVNEGGAPPADASTARDSSPESSDDGSLAVADAAPFDAGVACDPLPPPVLLPPAGVASGSRLTLRMVAESAPGGLAVPADVFDTALGVRCTPLKLADGTIRCVPDTTLYRPEPIFADAALTQPVVLIYLASAPATGTIEVSVAGGNVATPPLSDCAGNVRVGALGGQRSSQL
jgi:hypothetical protein